MKIREGTDLKVTEMTDDELNAEIKRLTASEAVRLARAEQRNKYRRQQYLYQLRNLEKRGNELIRLGYTAESFAAGYGEDDYDAEEGGR